MARAWQLLACIALFIALSNAFSIASFSDEDSHSGDLEVAASGHKESHSSGFEESGGSEHGSDHFSKV